MKKFFIVIILLIVIAGSFSFVILNWAFDDEENFINERWRHEFAASPVFRDIFALHDPGDAKANYLNQDYDKIFIEVDLMKGFRIRESTLAELAEKIQSVTGKQAEYLISDRNIPYQKELGQTELDQLVNNYRGYDFGSDTASLYLLYVSTDEVEKDFLGATYEEDGIVLFGEVLSKLVEENPEVLSGYQLSTALHEFGHQLGLEHYDKYHCLMNPAAEKADVAWQDPEDVVTVFCEEELREIRNPKY